MQFFRKNKTDIVNDEKMARLENAERDLASLRRRHEQATGTLVRRVKRNHWVETIEQMVQGGI